MARSKDKTRGPANRPLPLPREPGESKGNYTQWTIPPKPKPKQDTTHENREEGDVYERQQDA